ncbi:MAG TPA: phospholipase, partial [Bacteroidales bacterium]|nr:phospholipase [Bacteroidales bacterium]
MKKIIIFIAVFVPILAMGQKLTAHRNIVSEGYNFWLYTPAGYDSIQTSKPLFIFLHGSSLCGNDLSRVRRYGCIDAVENGHAIDALIVAPQNPGGSWNPKKINNVLNWVQEKYAFDTNRIYV